MTQEVQPLTWQKRTNIEEHQQFFAKINEIVGQLSGTVERSETALTEATVALAEASAAVAAANNASNQAQTAATTVAGYNTRLTAVEVQAATNKSDISQLDVETQDLYDRDAQSVKLSADHIQVIAGGLDLRGTNRSPNTSVGADDTVIANGHRIVSELAAYTPMMRTTGNQTVDGVKSFNEGLYGVNSVANIAAAQPNRWIGITYKGNTTQFCKFDFCNYINSATSVYIEGVMFWNGGNQGVFVKAYGYATALSERMKWTVDSDNNFTVWMRAEAYHTVMANVVQSRSWTNTMIPTIVYVDNPDFSGYAKSGNVTIQ